MVLTTLVSLASALSGPFKDIFAGDKDLIDKLKIELLTADAVLSDAEEKQITNPKVKDWLDELKLAAYDADNLLDKVTTARLELKKKIEANYIEGKAKATSEEIKKRISVLVPFHAGVIDRLKKILERLQNLAARRDLLNLKGSARLKPPPRHQTTSLLGESEVLGRDEDKKKLKKLLLGGTAQESGIPVIAIVGIPGVGKTTLAQLLYNDSEVEEHFSGGKAWVHVSEELDVLKVTRTIFESVDSKNCHVTDLNVLQVNLKTTLSGKKFLVVLDDIWNENFDWDLLSAPLKAGACESRIIVTTRNQGVASIMRAIATHHLPQLSEECCQKLFEKYAFGTSNPDDHPNLKSIGHDIAKKCQGLPLAAKTLGGLLYSELEAKQWCRILNSKIWDLPNDKNNILPALRLSYDHLHPHLKQCFAYCSMFSKGYEFEKEKLILMWMAEGFLQQQPNGEETMEEIGDKYFLELLSRSFFQASTHKKQHYVMHDLVIDLAQFVSGEFCFKLEDRKRIPEKVRHVAWLMKGRHVNEQFETLLEAKSMRTLLLLVSSKEMIPLDLRKIICERNLSTQLRVLSFPDTDIKPLDNVAHLKHLRYLDLSNTSITDLPSTICSLHNLQTLLLSNCSCLSELPKKIEKLTNLRHLDLRGSEGITELPPNFGKLTNLQMLTNFLVGKSNSQSSKISELGGLSCLRGKLSISGLENVDNEEQASKANLKSKNYLSELEFSWSNTKESYDDDELKVLKNLVPHTNLEKLTIDKYSGRKFPEWLSGVNLPNMVILKLTNCSFCVSLPLLGNLSSLKQLNVEGMKGLLSVNFGSRGDGGSGNLPFRSLKILSFKRLSSWTTLTCHSQFPSLQELTIEDCPQLPIFPGEGMPTDSIISTNSCLKTLSEQLRGRHTSLEVLRILLSNLQILGKSLSGLTSLKDLHIRKCKMPAELPNLESLVITDCKELEKWGFYRVKLPTWSETTNGCGGEKESSKEMPHSAHTLTSLCINIRPRKQPGSHEMESLTDFEITGKCNEEQSFPDEERSLQHLTSLKRLEIKCSMSIQAEGFFFC